VIQSLLKSLVTRDRVSVVLALFVVATASWAFLELADEIDEGESMSFDRQTLLALRSADDPNDPLGPVWFEEAARDVTSLGSMSVLVLLVLIVMVFLILTQKRRDATFLMLASTSGVLVSQSLKGFYSRDRPDLVERFSEVLTLSFPSGHSMLSAIVYLTLASIVSASLKQRSHRFYVFAVAVIITGLVGCSRVCLGVHYPTDVLAGWTAGLVWSLLAWFVTHWLQHQRTVEHPGTDENLLR
jgi:undecaprenyl-diphosphatase